MLQGNLIDQLIATVQLAEQHAQVETLDASAEAHPVLVYEAPSFQQLAGVA